MTLSDLYVEVTVADIVEAMERNGYRLSRESWITYNKDNTVQKACAMGQAAINLGITWQSLSDNMPSAIKWYIINLNDSKKLSCKEIADKVRIVYSAQMDKKIKARRQTYKLREKKNG